MFPWGRPRTRGGCPYECPSPSPVSRSSPHPRGLSARPRLIGLTPGVVPAPAGVVPGRPLADPSAYGRPRTRGGCPSVNRYARVVLTSSPHPRGLSRPRPVDRRANQVVPAPAGVVPADHTNSQKRHGRPRTRGGCPRDSGARRQMVVSFPHPRGLSRAPRGPVDPGGVVPAPAGVVPATRLPTSTRFCRPRTRGGCPSEGPAEDAESESSPHPRGCPGGRRWVAQSYRSSPHPRGLSRRRPHRTGARRVVPAPAGGCPSTTGVFMGQALSSPHPRGLSAYREGGTPGGPVVPAPAGVVRALRRSSPCTWSRPRTRGGCPLKTTTEYREEPSSPHSRGCPPPPRGNGARVGDSRPRTRGGCPLIVPELWADMASSPHPGGCPPGPLVERYREWSSSRPRGLSAVLPLREGTVAVVPAPAGVVRRPLVCGPTTRSRPRTRGGCPRLCHRSRYRPASSPHPLVLSSGLPVPSA
ncbi:hypothetical protein T261_6997 [Streptomyces lydicus]|nr:hypothetical protein T261_6997 [Streptomyces lydicus]